MKYKVGDIVKIKDDLSVEKYEEQSEQGIVEDMIAYRGQIAKVIEIDLFNRSYRLDIDNGNWAWEEFILEDVKCYEPTFDEEIVEQFLRNVNVDYTEYEEEIIGDISYNAIKSLFMKNTKLKQENSELKNRLAERVKYSQKLEEDLYGNMNKNNVNESINKIEEILKDLKEEMYNENDNL